MIEFYYKDKFGEIFACTKPGGSRKSYFDMMNESWQKASSIDRKAANLVKIRWQSLRRTNSYGTVSGQTNNQQQLFYLKDTGITNIRVPFYFYLEYQPILLFAFKKKDTKQENKYFKQAEKLQIEINDWINKYGFPSS